MGDRKTTTFSKLWNRVKNIECESYFSAWHSYERVLPKGKHVISKKETYTVESKNSQIRSYGSCFKRKTKCVSKSKEMIYKHLLLVVNKINDIARNKYKFNQRNG